jgi:hypothetical protein
VICSATALSALVSPLFAVGQASSEALALVALSYPLASLSKHSCAMTRTRASDARDQETWCTMMCYGLVVAGAVPGSSN